MTKSDQNNQSATIITKMADKLYSMDGERMTLDDLLQNFHDRLIALENDSRAKPDHDHSSELGLCMACNQSSVAPPEPLPDSLKFIIDLELNRLTLRGDVPDDFDLEKAIKAAIEILKSAARAAPKGSK